MAKITGRIEVLVNNELLLNKAGAVASGIGLSGQPNFELEAIMGDTGSHGYIEKPVQARCEVTITDRDDIMLSDLAAVRETKEGLPLSDEEEMVGELVVHGEPVNPKRIN